MPLTKLKMAIGACGSDEVGVGTGGDGTDGGDVPLKEGA